MRGASSDSSEGLPRKLTAVGTVGDVNQLFTVYEKNWNCTDCGQENYAARPRCFRCKKAKPANLNNYVMDPAFLALQQGQELQWQEVVDPNTYQVYYYNKVTGVTQWERPAELGEAPVATGWFGRGRAGASELYNEMNKLYLSRPARKQKDFIDPKKYHIEGAQEYNIWYGKYSGDYNDKMDREPATDRCKLETDAGYTKADLSNQRDAKDNKKSKKFFCIHFAHGICAKGAECTFYHRIPLPEDDARTDELFDCFGRQRHSKHKDDMSGVGSFMKPCRTLFVGNLQKTKYETPKALEDALWRHFGEWGELESLNVIHRLSIAFPRYRLRTSAEFAKEAMSCQKLDYDEVLSIRWAHDDPNPVAKDSIERADKDAMVALLRAKGISLTPAGYNYPAEYQLPEAKRLKVEDGGSLLEQHPDLAYPDTQAQYTAYYAAMAANTVGQESSSSSTSLPWTGYAAADASAMVGNQSSATDKQNALARLGLLDQIATPSAAKEAEKKVSVPEVNVENQKQSVDQENEGQAEEEDADEEEEEEEEGGWQIFTDETTGAKYYFNTSTGESSWTEPEGFSIDKKEE